ncbi:hypothetical protein ACFP3U_27900 [Kitasatospora misakiensis]|uniref:ATP-binding protein n=2 Tax=Kitasatospora misakiensis TaxID=67330 RepID=A0ABW0X893_9ACTN
MRRSTLRAGDQDIVDFVGFLVAEYGSGNRAAALLREVGQSPGKFFLEDAMLHVWSGIVGKALDDCWFVELVLVVRGKGHTAYAALFERILARADEPATDDEEVRRKVFGAALLDNASVIDRDALRTNLRKFAGARNSHVMVVNGEGTCGKTHSWYLIHHVGQCFGAEPKLVSFERWAGHPARPVEVMENVAGELGWHEVPKVAEDEVKQLNPLGRYFRVNAAGLAQPLWLVLDGVNRTNITDHGLMMVGEIAVSAHKKTAGDHLWVVLMDFERDLWDIESFVLRESIRGITADDVRRFFLSAAAESDHELSAERIDTLVREAVGSAPAVGPLPPVDLGPRADRLARAFFGDQGGTG